MKSAVNPSHKGVLRRAAQRAGESTQQYADQHKNDAGVTGKRARLAITFAKFRPK